MTAPRVSTRRRRRLSLALSVVALIQPALIMAVTSSTHATVARQSALTSAATREKEVHCGNDHGGVAATLPTTWHRVLKTGPRCAWEAPDAEHWIMLQPYGARTMPESRAAERAGDRHYSENVWHRQRVWGLSGRVWDHGLTVDGHRNRYRAIGVSGTRVTYIARHGTYDVWAHAFHRARTSSYLAG